MKLHRLLACAMAATLAAAPLQAQTASGAGIDRAMAELTESNGDIEGGAIYAAVLFIAFVVGALALDSEDEQTSP